MNLRHYLYRAKYRFGRYLNPKKPVDVSLELSSQCNMRCTYCYHSQENAGQLPFIKGVMAWETALKIMEQAAEMEVPSIKTNWKGESTINPHFERITKYARMCATGSTFQERITNSNFKFRLEREDIFRGLCNQTKVKVSFDSFDSGVFKTQRAGGNWNVTFRNIDRFYHWPGRDNELVIQAVRTKLNKDEDIEALVKHHWPEATVSIRDMVGGRTTSNLGQLEDRKRGKGRKSCLQAHVRLIFNWQGMAFPCCPDIGEQLKLGSIHVHSMEEIFNSYSAKKLRGNLKDGYAFIMDPCKTCSSFESYKGYRPAWNS